MNQPFLHLERSAKRAGDQVAISSPELELSYSELFDSSVRFAKVFRERGVKPGDVVGVNIPNFLDLVISQTLFHEACIGAQLPVGHLDVTNKYFDWIVVSEALVGYPSDRQIVVDQTFMRRLSDVVAVANPLSYPSNKALCRLSFSSGTTGKPKAIPVSIECLEDRSLERTRQWMPEEPYLCMLGLSTGLTFMSFYYHVANAKTFILAGDAKQCVSQVQKHGVACLMGSPHQINQLVQAQQKNNVELQSLRTVMSAGSVMPDSLTKLVMESYHAKVISTYASSEAGSTAVREGLGSYEAFAGNLLDDVDVKILDTSGNEAAEGQVGRIAIKRAKQPTEYFRDDKATLASYHDGYFLPGDLGYLEGRKLYLAGRSSEIINIAGLKVDPAWLENLVLEYQGVSDAAVCELAVENGLSELGLVLVAEAKIDAKILLRHLEDLVTQEFVPRHIVRVASIERNHMGKVNRSELAKLYFKKTE